MWTLKFWKDAGERAVRTFAQVLLAFLVIEGYQIGFEDVEWMRATSVGGVAATASVLFSIVGTGVGNPTDASLLPKKDSSL